jgi:hypothetical protein
MTGGTQRWLRICASAGMIVAPALWAMNSQLGQILPYTECGSRYRPALIVSIAAMVFAVGAAAVSWRRPWAGSTGRFWSDVCALIGIIFAFALLLQAGAAFMLTGCER